MFESTTAKLQPWNQSHALSRFHAYATKLTAPPPLPPPRYMEGLLWMSTDKALHTDSGFAPHFQRWGSLGRLCAKVAPHWSPSTNPSKRLRP